jgi:hypothetical protein
MSAKLERDTVRILGTVIKRGIVYRQCPKCKRLLPLDKFGLRRMKGRGVNGADLITNQSRCRDCR